MSRKRGRVDFSFPQVQTLLRVIDEKLAVVNLDKYTAKRLRELRGKVEKAEAQFVAHLLE